MPTFASKTDVKFGIFCALRTSLQKEVNMILNLKKAFAGYYLVRLAAEPSNYREVYVAEDEKGSKVFLTVYDEQTCEQLKKDGIMNEFALVKELKNEVLPKYMDSGTISYHGRKISFMTTEFFEFQKLREIVEEKPLVEEDALDIIHQLLIGLKEIQYRTHGGGHYNICPDTIWISLEKNKLEANIVGLEHASGPCNGNPGFIVSTLNKCCRAPETFLGRFSAATDVYSVGMLLAYMLQGYFPHYLDEGLNQDIILNLVRQKEQPTLSMAEALKPIVYKAINKSARTRYKNVDELSQALLEYKGMEKPRTFECFSYEKNDKFDDDDLKETNETDESKRSSHEPQLKVSISVKRGEGLKAVAGMEDLKRCLRRDFVDIITHKDLAKEFSILPPNMLFYGPPGTGKTFLSMRLAEECGLEFCSIKPSDLGSIWIHGTQSLIKELFQKAEEKAKKNKRGCLLLIDEFDALCGKRDTPGKENQADEVAEWLTQLNDCVEKNIYVIGTTNCLDKIDKAVIRHGRIDQVVYVGMPDEDCRKQLFDIELKKRPCEENIDTGTLARLTAGFTSSDIAYMVKETAIRAFEASLQTDDEHTVKISEAMLKEVVGSTRPSVTPDEVRAYERMRDEYLNQNKEKRQRIGFLA